jgi:hypothetical protein
MGHALRIDEARQKTPPLSFREVRDCAARLQTAVFDAIGEADVAEITRALVARARTGDPQAAKTVFALIGAAARIGDSESLPVARQVTRDET